MNVVVAGLAPREEAVLGFFLSRNLPTWTWQSAAVKLDATLPPADLYVADLAALGLARGSEAAVAKLQTLLQDTPAVLLMPAHDQTWPATENSAARHAWTWLAKPYGTQEMQAALEKAAACVTVAPPPAPPELPLATEAHGLSAAGLARRLRSMPDTRRYVFLRKLSEMLTLDRPFEARFTVQNSLIVHPAHGWIATNTPLMVIERVCQSDAMASAVSIREIDGDQAEERAQRLGMPPSELDIFLSDLVAATFDPSPPK
jgi:hypothetical protein